MSIMEWVHNKTRTKPSNRLDYQVKRLIGSDSDCDRVWAVCSSLSLLSLSLFSL